MESNWVFDRRDAAPSERLRTRRELLRLRTDGGGSRLTFKSAPEIRGGVKERAEHEFAVDDPAAARVFLESLGFEVTARYEKVRERWLLLGCEVALDRTPIGDFVGGRAGRPGPARRRDRTRLPPLRHRSRAGRSAGLSGDLPRPPRAARGLAPGHGVRGARSAFGRRLEAAFGGSGSEDPRTRWSPAVRGASRRVRALVLCAGRGRTAAAADRRPAQAPAAGGRPRRRVANDRPSSPRRLRDGREPVPPRRHGAARARERGLRPRDRTPLRGRTGAARHAGRRGQPEGLPRRCR